MAAQDPNHRGIMVDDLSRGRRPLGSLGGVAEFAVDASGNVTGLVGPDGTMSSLQRGAYSQNIGTRVENAQPLNLTNAGGRTFHEVYSTELGFDAVRFIYFNHQTSGTYTVGPAKCCVASDISTDQNQNGATWTNVTFDGGNTTMVITNTTDATNPVIAFSDWIPISSIDRTNDSSGLNLPVILVRTYFPSSTANISSVGPGLAHPTTGHQSPDGRVYIQRTQGSVDGVTTLSNFTQTYNGGNGGTLGVQYSARGRITNLFAVGDSITAGQKGRDPQYGWLARIKSVASTPSNPIEIANFGVSGQNTTTYAKRAAYLLQYMTKGVFIYPPFSANDNTTLTATVINTMMQNMQKALRAAYAANMLPLLWTSIPYANNNATTCGNTYATPGLNTITPVSMAGIANGVPIRLDLGAHQEIVTASNVTGSTFDCTTVYPHTATFAVIPLLNNISGFTSTDSFRTALTTTLTAYPGVDILNMSSLGNGASPELWLSVLDTYEGLHPEDNGNTKMANIANTWLSNNILKI